VSFSKHYNPAVFSKPSFPKELEILVDPVQLDHTNSAVTANIILLCRHHTFQHIDPVLLVSSPALTFDNGCCGLMRVFCSIEKKSINMTAQMTKSRPFPFI